MMRIPTILSIVLIILNLLISESMALDSVKETFTCLDKKTWQDCEKMAKSSKDKALIKIIMSQRFLDPNYKKNSFEGVIKFIQNNPHWPQVDKLKEMAEQYLNYNTDQALIVNWFSGNEPITALGYKFYALASKKLIKDPQKLAKIIKNGWIYGVFTQAEESNYLSNFKNILCEEDHVKKIDEYLWTGDTCSAKKYMHYVSNGYKQNFITQIAILSKSNTSEKLFQQVSEKYYTPALLFNYLDSKKKEIPTSQSIALFKKVKQDKIHSAYWARVQSYYAREFIDQKDFVSSYKIISIPLTVYPEHVREAEWLSGWLALRFLHKPDIALSHFNKFMKVAAKPLSVSRGQYWLARTYEAKGDKEQANKFYHMASKYSHSFYGQLANIELNKRHFILPQKPTSTKHNNENSEIIRAIKHLIKYGKHDLALLYAKTAIEKSSKPSEILLITNIISTRGNTYHTVEVAKTACQHHTFIKDYAFPTPYTEVVKNTPLEPALTYSIMRQESVFNQHAVSTARAKGLMQLTDVAAYGTAKSIGCKCHIKKLTLDPKYNIMLGTNHFKEILEKFDGSYLLAIAAYNAGPNKVDRWINLFGDPRDLKDLRQIIDWIELIPYYETRNYAQRVLENLQVYRSILNKNNNLKLKQDLLKTKDNKRT
ncbi:transglycosylase SLT domain-containing protein [Candidatus Tisiphia endosymbiont of Micropterix aruncella]|uniref:lytic transglycosylase domain-containing protein n=1 Tax=Candidatus Tisiphia endosymbiont of Micropterix aruncella TaxID=3066271 RepID=UPI003AA99F69